MKTLNPIIYALALVGVFALSWWAWNNYQQTVAQRAARAWISASPTGDTAEALRPNSAPPPPQ